MFAEGDNMTFEKAKSLVPECLQGDDLIAGARNNNDLIQGARAELDLYDCGEGRLTAEEARKVREFLAQLGYKPAYSS